MFALFVFADFLGVSSSHFLPFWPHKLLVSAVTDCDIYKFGQVHLVCGVITFFVSFLRVTYTCCTSWFFSGFLGATSSVFISFWLDNSLLSAVRAWRAYYFGQKHLICSVVAFFFVLFVCCHPSLHSCFFLPLTYIRKHVLWTHLGLFLPYFPAPPVTCIHPRPHKPIITHFHAFEHLFAWSAKTSCSGKFPRP